MVPSFGITLNSAVLLSVNVKSAGVLTLNSPIAESISLNFSTYVRSRVGIVNSEKSSMIVFSVSDLSYQPT